MDDPVKEGPYDSSPMALNKELEINTQTQKIALITARPFAKEVEGSCSALDIAHKKRWLRLTRQSSHPCLSKRHLWHNYEFSF
jgi:hypothetical protein